MGGTDTEYRNKIQNMTSRKRNKGKDRKAKKAELEAEKVESERAHARQVWQEFARGLDGCGGVITLCNHGALTIPDDKNHPVVSFLDTLFVNMLLKSMKTSPNLHDTVQKHADVWNNVSQRKMTMNILLRVGTNAQLLVKEMMPGDVALYLSHVIAALENYNGGDIDSHFNSRIVATKIRDLHFGTKRDMLKFYRKRVGCSCLRKIHLEARKTIPKVGKCYHCRVVKERAVMMVCSRCRIDQYCSRECQISDWPRHRVTVTVSVRTKSM